MLLPGGSKLLAASGKTDLFYATLVPPFWRWLGPCLAYVLWFRGSLPAFKDSCRMQGTTGVVWWHARMCPEGLSVLRRVSLAARTDLTCTGLHDGDVMLLAASSEYRRRCGCNLLWDQRAQASRRTRSQHAGTAGGVLGRQCC